MTPPLAIDEAATMLGVKRRTVYALIAGGKLTAFKVGRVLRIDVAEIERFKTANQVTPVTTTTAISDVHTSPAALSAVNDWGKGADRFL